MIIQCTEYAHKVFEMEQTLWLIFAYQPNKFGNEVRVLLAINSSVPISLEVNKISICLRMSLYQVKFVVYEILVLGADIKRDCQRLLGAVYLSWNVI